ncbi:hypothetical protein HY383_04715 [Candidatus Daviesbacteria bacterium]|nr:hypothetical protein [Candidatus Daviesbacteria bacterium]
MVDRLVNERPRVTQVLNRQELESVMLRQGIDSGRPFRVYQFLAGRLAGVRSTLVVSQEGDFFQALDINPETGQFEANTYPVREVEALTPSHVIGGGVVLQECAVSPISREERDREVIFAGSFFNIRLQEIKTEIGRRLGLPCRLACPETPPNIGIKIDSVI